MIGFNIDRTSILRHLECLLCPQDEDKLVDARLAFRRARAVTDSIDVASTVK